MSVETAAIHRDKVLKHKQQHMQQRERRSPWGAMAALAAMQAHPRDILNYVDGRVALIGQVRYTTPLYDPVAAAMDMIHEGADAIAFFTDHTLYPDDLEDMYLLARACRDVPVLYQNYVLNIYQVAAARASDASAIMLHSGACPAPMLRDTLTTAQRFRFTVFVSVSSWEELERAAALSPHVICIGCAEGARLDASLALLRQAQARTPRHIKLMLGHTLRTPDEAQAALLAGVRALIVDASLLSGQSAQWVRQAVGKV